MTPNEIAKLIAVSALFGMVFICPLVMLFLRHQRLMTEMLRGKASDETHRRLEAVEHELRQLRAAHHELVLRADDQQELRQRIT